MAATITINLDDKTAAGWKSLIDNEQKAGKATDQMAAKLSAFAKQQNSMTNRLSQWSRQQAKATQEAREFFAEVESGATRTAQRMQVMGNSSKASLDAMAGGTGNLTRGMLEASRGIEDFSSQIGTAGLGGALRASGNNMSQMAFVMGGPLAGAIAGVSVAVGTTLIPMLFNLGDEAKETERKLAILQSRFEGLEAARVGAMNSSIGDQGNTIKTLRRELTIHESVTKEILRQQSQEEVGSKASKELLKQVQERWNAERAVTVEIDERKRLLAEEKQSLRELADIQSMNEFGLGPNKDTIGQRKRFEDQQRQIQKDDAKRKRDEMVANIEDQKELDKLILDAREKRKKFEQDTRIATEHALFNEKGLQHALKKINDMREDELDLIKRKKELTKEAARQEEADARRIKAIKEAAFRRETQQIKQKERAAQREAQREIEKARKEFEKQVKQLQQQPGFAGNVQQTAKGISQGQLLRQAAEQRFAGRDLKAEGFSRGQIEKGIRNEMAKIRQAIIKGTQDPAELRKAQSQLIKEQMQKNQQLNKTGIGQDLKAQNKQATGKVLGGEVTQQQVAKAQNQLVQSSTNLAKQQGLIGKKMADGLTAAAQRLDEQQTQQEQIEAQLDEVMRFMKSIGAGSRARSQRAGLGR